MGCVRLWAGRVCQAEVSAAAILEGSHDEPAVGAGLSTISARESDG
jgi:hypothetical protein